MAIEESSLNRCPICFSILVEPYSNLAQVATYLKEQSAIPQSVEISEENVDLKELVITGLNSLNKEAWQDDPILTQRGYAGEDYKGFTTIHKNHIYKIQERRKEQEIDASIPEDERTTFTEINPNETYSFCYKNHILELRQSTEKILKVLGYTKEVDGVELADLEYYFNYDENGDHKGTFKYDTNYVNKTEWTDIDRAIEGEENEPNLPEGIQKIKNIHIEDLRHSIPIGWFDDFTEISPLQSASGTETFNGLFDGGNRLVVDLDVTDKKTDELLVDGYVRMENSGVSINTPGTTHSGTVTVVLGKPLSISLNAQAGSEGVIEDWRFITESSVTLRWVTDKFVNPSPHPNIKIRQGKKGYIIFNASGSKHGSDSYIGFNLSVRFLDKDGNIAKTLSYSVRNTYYSEQQTPGSSSIKLPMLFGNNQKIEFDFYTHLETSGEDLSTDNFYFCDQIIVQPIASANEFVEVGSGNATCNLNFTFVKIGY